jgi:hypothetical protein
MIRRPCFGRATVAHHHEDLKYQAAHWMRTIGDDRGGRNGRPTGVFVSIPVGLAALHHLSLEVENMARRTLH